MVFLIHARHGIESEDLKIAILFETLIFKSYFQRKFSFICSLFCKQEFY